MVFQNERSLIQHAKLGFLLHVRKHAMSNAERIIMLKAHTKRIISTRGKRIQIITRLKKNYRSIFPKNFFGRSKKNPYATAPLNIKIKRKNAQPSSYSFAIHVSLNTNFHLIHKACKISYQMLIVQEPVAYKSITKCTGAAKSFSDTQQPIRTIKNGKIVLGNGIMS